MRFLVVTAVAVERDAVVRGLGAPRPVSSSGLEGLAVETPAGPLHAFAGGVGPVAAAITTTRLLATGAYDAIISAGLGGGFVDKADVGSLVVADRVSFADLGARTDDGFLTLREMKLGQETTYPLTIGPIYSRILGACPHTLRGEILTVACMTGTKVDADALARHYPLALAEAMEGFGVVESAIRQPQMPRYITEIRAVSNVIGPRDPAAWKMPEAFDALANAFAALLKEPLS